MFFGLICTFNMGLTQQNKTDTEIKQQDSSAFWVYSIPRKKAT